jgi:hypothetical protein
LGRLLYLHVWAKKNLATLEKHENFFEGSRSNNTLALKIVKSLLGAAMQSWSCSGLPNFSWYNTPK